MVEDDGDFEKLFEEEQSAKVNLSHLETTDSDPKVRIKKALANYFQSSQPAISRVQFRDLLCQYYHELSYDKLKKFYFLHHKRQDKNYLQGKSRSLIIFYEDLDVYLMTKKTLNFKYPEVEEILASKDYYKFFSTRHKDRIRK